MIFIAVNGLALICTLLATGYEGVARKRVPWGFVGCSLLFAALLVASLLIFL